MGPWAKHTFPQGTAVQTVKLHQTSPEVVPVDPSTSARARLTASARADPPRLRCAQFRVRRTTLLRGIGRLARSQSRARRYRQRSKPPCNAPPSPPVPGESPRPLTITVPTMCVHCGCSGFGCWQSSYTRPAPAHLLSAHMLSLRVCCAAGIKPA